MMYIDPLGLDTAKIKDGGNLPEVKIYGYYYPYNPFCNPGGQWLAQERAKRDVEQRERYGFLASSSNKRPLTSEELLAERKAEEDRLRRLAYASNRHKYGKMQTDLNGYSKTVKISPLGPALIFLGAPIVPKRGGVEGGGAAGKMDINSFKIIKKVG